MIKILIATFIKGQKNKFSFIKNEEQSLVIFGKKLYNMLNFILCYVDPGTTGFAVQIIIAAIVGVAFFFKTIWWRIKSFFSKKTKEEK